MAQKKNRRNAIIAALAVLVVALAVGGTIAWLTASSTVTNTFTVGAFNPPTDDDNDGDPDDPPTDSGDDENGKLTGNIYEDFKDGSKANPGATVTKTPYVGLGKGSEDGYVYVYVQNKTLKDSDQDATKAAYFTLGEGWMAVAGQVDKYTGVGAGERTYTGGLFVACGSGSAPAILEASEDSDVWTAKVFQDVTFPDALTAEDFAEKPAMDVSCYIYAAEGADLVQMETDAITWANGLDSTE